MDDYTKENIIVFKNVIEDYNIIKTRIDDLIDKGATLNDLKDFVENILKYEIENFVESEIITYMDFGCKNMTLSIYKENGKIFLGDSIEIWDDFDYLGQFSSINEIKALVNFYEEKKESVNNE